MIQKILKSGIFAAALLLSGCGGDNAYTGTGVIGGGSSAEQKDAMASIQQNVFIPHADGLVTNIITLQNAIKDFDANVTDDNVKQMQASFKFIMQEWKSVQSSYIAGDYDRDLIDTPQLFDFYNTGKKLDVPADIDKALNSSVPIEDALIKNSSRSITALAYLVYGDNMLLADMTTEMNKDNKRRVDAVSVTLDNLKILSSDMASFYQNDTKFATNTTDASNAIVNTLIDSAFKLKEWRVGEAAGIALKFKDNPNPNRLEYVQSTLSSEAMEAILKTHQDIMGVRSYENFGSFASENGAEKIVNEIRIQINAALSLVNELKPIEDAITTSGFDPKVQELYDTAKTLQVLYFDSLIQALNLTAEIIEADGD